MRKSKAMKVLKNFLIIWAAMSMHTRYKKQVPISKETFTQICWEVGMSDAADFIKFESDEQERYRKITEEF